MTDQQTELELLKQRADEMDIGYHPKIGVESLKKKINTKINPPTKAGSDSLQGNNSERMRLMKEAKILKRVLIINQNPTKKEWGGEYIGVSNSAIGTIKRYVPFDLETHVEDIILKQIKTRKMTRFYTEKNELGQKVRKFRLVPEFSVSMLDPLTPAELKQLADDQVKRGAID